jgi:hypothetical protein
MKKYKITFFIFLLSLLQSIAAHAQIQPNTISIGTYMGVIAPDITNKFYRYDRLHDKLKYGLSLAWDFEYHTRYSKIGIEILSQYNFPKACDSDGFCFNPFYTFHLYGNIIFYLLPEKRYIPYLSGGPGFVYMDLNWRGDEKKFHLIWNYGGGYDFFIKRHWLIRIDARLHQYKLSTQDWDIMTLKEYGTSRENIGWMWYFQLTGGIRYQF